jgi:Dolichyl-phosphate-mannose-protein mannosyltransferase
MILNRVLKLILISTIVRMIIAWSVELSNDEVYYYGYAADLQLNYFDHPPGVGILIRIFTGNLFFTNELFVRLGAIVCAAIGTWLSYRLGKLLKNDQTGWYAAMLYTTGIYSSLLAGTFIIPDSPQVVLWLASLLIMYEIILAKGQNKNVTVSRWIFFGLLSGLSVLCKVHGIFIWFGFGLYILFYQRTLLKDYRLYLSAILTLLVISPILIWNIQNDFITYRFHSERVSVKESLFHLDYFFQTFFGQLLYNNPINAVLMIIAVIQVSSKNFLDKSAMRFVLLNGLPIILVVTLMALFNPVLPHWSGPGFMVLSFLTAAWLEEKKLTILPKSLRASTILISCAVFLAILLINLYPGTIGSKDEHKYGDGDFTLDMYGWKNFAGEFDPWLKEQINSQQLSENIQIVAEKWFPASHLDFYVARPIGLKVIGVGEVTDLHQYYWYNKDRPVLQKGASAICIVPTNNQLNMEQTYLRYFSGSELLKTFESTRSGNLVRKFEVYLLKDYQMNDEVHQ